MYEQQIHREEASRADRKLKYLRDMGNAIDNGRSMDTAEGKMLFRLGFFTVKEEIQRYLDTKELKGHTKALRNYLLLLSDDIDEITYTVLSTIISEQLSKDTYVTVRLLSAKIVNELSKLHLINRCRDKHPKLYNYIGTKYHRASSSLRRTMVLRRTKDLLSIEAPAYIQKQSVRLGATLIKLVIASGANIIEKTRLYDPLKRRMTSYVIELTDEAELSLLTYSSKAATLCNPVFKPMIHPPRPWTSFYSGGLLSTDTPFIKTNTDKIWYKQQDYSKVFNPINKLQSVEWRVNKKIFDIVSTIFNGNTIDPTSPPTLPRLYGDLPTSTVYSAKDLIPYDSRCDTDQELFDKYQQKLVECDVTLRSERSRRLSLVIALSIAKEVVEYDKIYFPYQLDYRGRVYSITTGLTPQGPSYVKALLEFGKGEILTEVGEYWLKVHIANTYGRDKDEFDDRIVWFEDNKEDIIRAARSPLDTIGIWNVADSPFEFLAACMAYLDHIEGREVYLPIQLDATNSGLQFYSGILGDKKGAELVNVVNKVVDNKVIRADVYQEVANAAQEWLESSESPNTITFNTSDGVDKVYDCRQEKADLIKYGISRSMVKKNVMTIPYSVSMIGMSKQNRDTLDELELYGKQFWRGEKWIVNRLLTESINRTAYKLLQGAKEGQAYLKEVMKHTTAVATWYTPIFDLPVKQKSMRSKAYSVKTELGEIDIYLGSKELNRSKQSSSIAPNFIHSLDATVLLSILEKAEGFSVGVIHDCFLVSPNNGNNIRDLYRDSFIELMMLKPLEHFSRQIDLDEKVVVPYIGTLDLADVHDAKYIIS
jgi:DNA-directed RNA polymerase